MKAPLLALWLGLAAASAHADSVMLTGTIGNRAILVVDGGAPKTVAVGEKVKNVRLLSLRTGWRWSNPRASASHCAWTRR